METGGLGMTHTYCELITLILLCIDTQQPKLPQIFCMKCSLSMGCFAYHGVFVYQGTLLPFPGYIIHLWIQDFSP